MICTVFNLVDSLLQEKYVTRKEFSIISIVHIVITKTHNSSRNLNNAESLLGHVGHYVTTNKRSCLFSVYCTTGISPDFVYVLYIYTTMPSRKQMDRHSVWMIRWFGQNYHTRMFVIWDAGVKSGKHVLRITSCHFCV